MTISHTEFCGTLDKSSLIREYSKSGNSKLGAGLKLPLNAGDGITFPWLNAVANRYEKYQFSRLRFKFVPSVSKMYGGALAMCPVYDPSDAAPETRRELYNTEGAVHAPIHSSVSLTIPSKRISKEMYVRGTHSDLVDSNELRLSDLGYVTVTLFDLDDSAAQSTVGGAHAFGDVFVEYEVKLMSPRVSSTSGKHAHFSIRGGEGYFAEGGKIHAITDGNQELSRSDYHGPQEHDTLAIEYAGQVPGLYKDGSGQFVDCDLIKFNEPFTGMMTTNLGHYKVEGAPKTTDPTITVNGKNHRDVSFILDEDHPDMKYPLAITESLTGSQDTSGDNRSTTQLTKVVAQAGEVIAIARSIADVAGTALDLVGDMTWTEMGEAALALLL